MAIDLINDLITKKKYKKAQQLIKKHLKQQGESLELLELEAHCCFYLKQLKQSVIIYKKLLNYSVSNSVRVGFLNNLAVTYNQLKQPNLILDTYKQSVNLDPSANNAFAREQYCITAIQNNQPSDVLDYIDPLLSLADYSDNAHIMKLDAAIQVGNTQAVESTLKKLQLILGSFKDTHAALLMNVLKKHGYNEQLTALLVANKARFAAMPGYDELTSEQPKTTTELVTPKRENYRVEGSNKILVKLINKLINTNEQAGAFFSPLIDIVANEHGLSIKTPYPVIKKTPLINIPLTCMPLLCDYDLTVNNNNLLCKPHNQQCNPAANDTMALMVDIYNQTNKLKDWQQSSVFFSLANHPELLNSLVAGKKHVFKIMNFYKLHLENKKDKLLLDSFLGARIFGYKKEQLARQNIKVEGDSEAGLLSVIDFINHRLASSYYQDSSQGIGISAPAGQGENDELFVQYNYFDPLSTLLIYGFVDLSSPYLFSVPVNMQLADGREAQVLGNNPFGNETVSDSGKHLAKYVPNIIKIDKGITLDSLSIPDLTNINQLRDVLTTVVKSVALNDNLTDTALMAEVYSLEKQLLQLNLKYWHHLERLFKQQDNVPVIASEQLDSLIDFAKKHISQYANHFGTALF